MKTTHEHAQAVRASMDMLTHRAHDGDREAVLELRDLALRAISTLDSLTSEPADHPEIPEPIRAGVDAAHEVASRSLQWPVRWDAIQEIREKELGKVPKDSIGRLGKRGIGNKVGIRIEMKLGQKKPRDFGPHGISGFGLDVWQEIEAERTNPKRQPHVADIYPEAAVEGVLTEDQLKRDWKQLAAILEPLTESSLESWVNAGTRLCESWTEEWRLENHHTIPDLPRIRKIPQWDRFPWIQSIKNKASETQEKLDGETTKRGVKASIRGKVRESLRSILR